MTSSVINRAKRMIFWLCIIFCGCASSAPLQEPSGNCRCFLPCDGAPELKKHDSVRVLVQPHLSEVRERIYNVSRLYDRGRCSVPECVQGSMHLLQMYANDEHPVSKILLNKTDLQPECDPEGRSDSNSADGKLCNTLLISLAICFLIVFPLQGPI